MFPLSKAGLITKIECEMKITHTGTQAKKKLSNLAPLFLIDHVDLQNPQSTSMERLYGTGIAQSILAHTLPESENNQLKTNYKYDSEAQREANATAQQTYLFDLPFYFSNRPASALPVNLINGTCNLLFTMKEISEILDLTSAASGTNTATMDSFKIYVTYAVLGREHASIYESRLLGGPTEYAARDMSQQIVPFTGVSAQNDYKIKLDGISNLCSELTFMLIPQTEWTNKAWVDDLRQLTNIDFRASGRSFLQSTLTHQAMKDIHQWRGYGNTPKKSFDNEHSETYSGAGVTRFTEEQNCYVMHWSVFPAQKYVNSGVISWDAVNNPEIHFQATLGSTETFYFVCVSHNRSLVRLDPTSNGLKMSKISSV